MTQYMHASLRNEGLFCGSCVGRVEETLSALVGVSDVSVNLASEQAHLTRDSPHRIRAASDALDTMAYPARRSRVRLSIASMSCASCVGRVDKALADVPRVLAVAVNLATEAAIVEFLEAATAPMDLMEATAALGYATEIAEANTGHTRAQRQAEEAKGPRRNVVHAAVLTLPVFGLETGAHLIPAFHMVMERSIGTQTSWIIRFAPRSCSLDPAVGSSPRGIRHC